MSGNGREFNLGNYRRILARALELGYSFQTFSGYLEKPQEKVILLRHDVDVSLERAMEMAQLEEGLKILSTYFVRLHASFYNLLDHDNLKRLQELLVGGFEIGLHQEVNRCSEDIRVAVELLKREKALLETLLGQPLRGVSAHLPKRKALRGSAELLAATGFDYSPSQEIFNQGAIFISDSNRQWKEFSFQEALGRSDKILANIHPVWWVGKFADKNRLIDLLKEGK